MQSRQSPPAQGPQPPSVGSADLTQRVGQLERVNGHQTSFLARLSHELRNALSPLHHSLELLRRQSRAPSMAPTADLIQRQLNYLGKLVDELLDAERIAQGKLTLHKQTVMLHNLIDDATALSRSALTERGHQLTLEVPEQTITLEADPTRLTQVLVNLLVNAAKYTPPGGKVALRAHVHADRLYLEVSDNGIGLSEEELPLIFDLYAQAASGRRMDAGGLGVGLALARQLTELHGGALKAHSDGPGRGSFFPGAAFNEDSVNGQRRPTRARPRRQSKRYTPGRRWRGAKILVVDDHTDASDTLALALQCLGYEAHSCYSGPQAIARARELKPQAALLDLSMPGMDGYELAKQLRHSHPAMTLVAMTGWADEADRVRCLQAGFDGHMSKPASIEAIEALLSSLSERSRH
ncbi:MAG: response regulator [Betaproteobacteria bacterium]|nr:response regulator [Betaproteobacteria bacterium]